MSTEEEISDVDFVNSFLAAARARKLSVVAIYGHDNKLVTVSNVGAEGMRAVLSFIRDQPLPAVPDQRPLILTGSA